MIDSPLAGASSTIPTARPHVVTRRAVTGWILYDLANTIFSMGVVSLYFSLWVRDAVGAVRVDARLRPDHRGLDGRSFLSSRRCSAR